MAFMKDDSVSSDLSLSCSFSSFEDVRSETSPSEQGDEEPGDLDEEHTDAVEPYMFEPVASDAESSTDDASHEPLEDVEKLHNREWLVFFVQ